jgi:hypothetical protein
MADKAGGRIGCDRSRGSPDCDVRVLNPNRVDKQGNGKYRSAAANQPEDQAD